MIWAALRLARDDRGVSVIELGLVAPVLAALLVGMVDVSGAFAARLQLEQAAQRAIEKVQQYRTTSSTYSTLKAEAAVAAGVAESAVTVDYWRECNGVRASTYDSSCAAGDTQTRYISVAIRRPYTPLFGSRHFPGANGDGSYTLIGRAGLRTQ